MKLSFPLALLLTLLVAGAAGWGLSHAFGGSGSPAAQQARPLSASARACGRRRYVKKLPHGWSYTAMARGHKLVVHRRRRNGGTLVVLRNPNPEGAHVTLLVRRACGRWVQVFLPMRPNGIKGWVRLRTVRLLSTAYALHVNLRRRRLYLMVANHVRRRFTIGVGRSVTPTPSGRYFITELLRQPDPSGPYGPYAFGLSAYSGVLKHFGRGGNGQIGIHGTDAPWAIGSDVSHGCIRLRNPDIVWLAHRLPLGIPVTIDRA
jgi:L,D-transpeptidase catalytic domain